MSRLGNLAAVATALALPAVAHAQTETRVGARASANVGYSNNPFAQTGGGTSSGYVGVGLSPAVQLAGPRSTFTLSGDVQVQKYFENYPNNENYRVGLDYSGTPTSRLTTNASIDLTSAIIGSFGAFDTVGGGGGIIPDPDGGIVLPPINDIGLFGTRDRRRSVRGTGDLSYALSERDAITASAFGDISRYRRFELGDYDAYGGTLGYSRQVSGTIRVGAQGSYSSYKYDPPRGKTQVYTAQGTVFARLNERWTADGRLGVSFVDGGTIGSTRSNSISGGLNLCRRGPLSSFCLDASRDVRPTGFNGAQYVTAVGVSWSWRKSDYDTLSLSAGYSREGGARNPLFPIGQNQYARATAGYDRRLSERLSLNTSIQYRDIYGSGLSRSADYGGRIGLSYRIGDLR